MIRDKVTFRLKFYFASSFFFSFFFGEFNKSKEFFRLLDMMLRILKFDMQSSTYNCIRNIYDVRSICISITCSFTGIKNPFELKIEMIKMMLCIKFLLALKLYMSVQHF